MDLEKLTALILVVGGFLSSVVTPIVLGYMQARNKKDDSATQRDKTGLEIYQSLTEDLQAERLELRAEIETYKGERTLLIKGMTELEGRVDTLEKQLEQKDKELQEAKRQFDVKEKSYLAAINNQNDKIAELEKKINRVKSTTDELKKQTGDLPGKVVQ